MFWGVTIQQGRRYSQIVEKSYHVSKATLELPLKDDNTKKRAQIYLEHNKSNYLLANLDTQNNVQVDLDLVFTSGEIVTFYLKGEGTVHLTGYILDFEDDEDESDLSDEEEFTEATNENSKRVNKSTEPANTKKTKVESVKSASNGLDSDEEVDSDDQLLGELDEDMSSYSDENDEESDEPEESDEEEDEEEEADAKPVGKPVAKPQNGPFKPQQNVQQKATPNKGPQQNQQKPQLQKNHNQKTPQGNQKGGNQPNANQSGGKFGGQNKFGQNSPQGRPQQKGGNQQFGGQKGGFGGQHKNGNFTPDQKDQTSKKYPQGLQVKELQPGHGPIAKKGRFVHVRYVGRLPNNKEFDRSGNKPFSFKLGAGSVIKGWELGVEGMRVGEKRQLVVPPGLGYGNRSMGPIPANSTLNFEVELVSVT